MEILSGCEFFRGIGAEDIRRLLDCLGCRRRGFPAGGAVWHAGDEVRSAGIVLRGAIRAESVSAAGRLSVEAAMGPGQVFGDVLMGMENARSPVDIIAQRGTEILTLPFENVMGGCANCCECHARLRMNLMDAVAARYWELRRRAKYLTEPSLRARIALFLLDRADAARSASFDTGLSREAMAAYLGVNRSALSRELGRMRAEGSIGFSRSRFTLLSEEALREALS